MEPEFTGSNYSVCEYCKSLVRGKHRDGSNDGCKQVINKKGEYARLIIPEEEYLFKDSNIDYVNIKKGCEKFEPSGVPAHPKALERLIKNNSLCSSVPSDPNALETSWDFYEKVNKFLPKDNIVSSEEVQ